jgi:ribonucleotide reductase alpha subunit
MIGKKHPVNFVNGVKAFVNPAQCLDEIVQTLTEYLTIAEKEKTKRYKIRAWEKVQLVEIEAKRDLLVGYLERSFDERAENFQLLFQLVDQAISSGNNQQLSLALQAVIELAKSSPFKDLANLSTVKAALGNPEYIWEF